MKTKESNMVKKILRVRGRTAAPLKNLSESKYFVLAGKTIRTDKSYELTDFLAKTNSFVLIADRPLLLSIVRNVRLPCISEKKRVF